MQKRYVFLIISYAFFLTKLKNKRVEQVLPGSKRGGWAVAQTMYPHVSKCKNGKINKNSIYSL
jgi:hypothetical protein